jgi:UDP-N-acetylglucosamine 1-carboxyvinyltransferase
MKTLLINGGNRLYGSVRIAGAKNAALPLMVASILTKEQLTLTNIPHVSDIATMANLLENLGVEIEIDGFDQDYGHQGRVCNFTAKNISNPIASYDLVSKMRASIVILGPLLARFKKAKVSLPGGCAIGSRPVDLHIMAMEKMGAKIELKEGYIEASAKYGLQGSEINFNKISVGATQSTMMAATLADGQTIINNAAQEPEIIDLANCLIAMGAKIEGVGTNIIKINGVKKLYGTKHKIISDRIEAGTYMVAAAITGGEIKLTEIEPWVIEGFKNELIESGLEINIIEKNVINVVKKDNIINPINITTKPFPGFPTDMQAQFMALMTLANGISKIEETIFENRFMHILELVRMGAEIKPHGNIALVNGVKNLNGAKVMATDLRASVSLVLAGLAAKGQTSITRLYHLERGYERITEKLNRLGADIKIEY